MTVSVDDFEKLDLRVGTVQAAREHPDADRLYLLEVDLGEREHRQLVAGLKADYEAEELEGVQVVVVVNLEPATIRGERSEGMVLAADADRRIALLTPDASVPNGTVVR